MGLAKASPTMATVFTLSRSTVSRSSTGSKWRLVSVTTQPPTVMAAMDGEPPGAVHERTGGEVQGTGSHDGLADAVDAPVLGHAQEVPGVELGEQVVLAPHDAFGHARGAAGVEEVEVVAGARPTAGPLAVPRSARRVLVGGRPRRARVGAVVDPQPGPDARHA